MPEEKPEDITPEIEIEIKPEGDSTPSSASDDLPPPPADDDLPPVPDDDELPPVPIDDDLPPVPDGDDLPPIPDGDDLPPIPDDDTPPGTLDEPSTGDEPVIDIVLDDDGGGSSAGTELDISPPPPGDDDGSNAGGTTIGTAPVATKLVLISESGQRLSMNVSTDLGKNNCKALGEEARYLDTKQMTLEKTGDGWQVVPSSNTSNETILNARAITEPEVLKTGDVLAVGRESKGVVKMKMTVQVD